MKRIRYQDDEPSIGGVATGVVLGALAGLIVGIVIAQRAGGISGLAARLRERLGAIAHPEDEEESHAHAHHDGYDEEEEEDELDINEDDDLDADAALEEGVLRAFQRDVVLSERAIDIGAVGDGIIELSGWVETNEESERAMSVTRSVPGIVTVVNRLFVGDEEEDDDSDLDEDELDGESNAPLAGGVWEGQRVGTGRRRQGNSGEMDRHADPKPVLEDKWLDEDHALDEAAGPIDGIAERRRGKKAKGAEKPASEGNGPGALPGD
ncbi:MAG TPA: BON domain-containing protein [Gemmatimonadaceae bacterium]|nr:BON domain-containing protein [Gemmatimonadaceae bacterium]